MQSRVYPTFSQINRTTPWIPIFFRPRTIPIVQILISTLLGSPYGGINLVINSRAHFFFFSTMGKLSTLTPLCPHFSLHKKESNVAPNYLFQVFPEINLKNKLDSSFEIYQHFQFFFLNKQFLLSQGEKNGLLILKLFSYVTLAITKMTLNFAMAGSQLPGTSWEPRQSPPGAGCPGLMSTVLCR